MLEHLSLNFFFSLASYLVDFHVFFGRWIHKHEKKIWILFIQRICSRKSLGNEQQECPAKHRKRMVPDSCQSNHWLETSHDDHTPLYDLLCFQ